MLAPLTADMFSVITDVSHLQSKDRPPVLKPRGLVKVYSLYNAFQSLGMGFGPILIGGLYAGSGWTAAVVCLAGICLTASVLAVCTVLPHFPRLDTPLRLFAPCSSPFTTLSLYFIAYLNTHDTSQLRFTDSPIQKIQRQHTAAAAKQRLLGEEAATSPDDTTTTPPDSSAISDERRSQNTSKLSLLLPHVEERRKGQEWIFGDE